MLLFVFESVASYRLQKILIGHMIARGHAVALLFTGNTSSFPGLADEAVRLGVRVDTFADRVRLSEGRPLSPRLPTASLAVRARLSAWSARTAVYHDLFARRLALAQELLDEISPSALICSEDGISSDIALITAARFASVPIVDVPYGFGSLYEIERDLARKAREDRLNFATGWNLWRLGRIAPQWVKKGNFAGALMHDARVILAWEALGITVRDPWIIHGGYSDILCVENEVAFVQYLREGISLSKLERTGSPYCDYMVRSLAENVQAAAAFRKPARIEQDVTRVLVSWFPSYHADSPGANEFTTYDEMTVTVLGMLASLPRIKLTVSLHPACSSDTSVVLQSLGIECSTEYVLKLIPANDVFITYFSSTIRWALAAGKVVINYDAYRLGLSTFDGAPGFVNARSFEALTQIMKAVTTSGDFLSLRSAAQIRVADDWGVVDGNCNGRIEAVVDRVSRPYKGARTACSLKGRAK